VSVSYDTEERQVTRIEYQAFQEAYDHFNTTLFAGTLPQVLVTLQRRGRSYGYMAPDRFTGRASTDVVHELALNPDHFTGRSDREILSTLVHEQVHVWQYTHGTPSRRGYHDREWAAKMREIGLHPSHTGLLGGRQTGQRMDHYIVAGGAYDMDYDRLAHAGFVLHWESPQHDPQRAAKRASKTKYTCPACGLNAWAKPGVSLVCGDCHRTLDEEAV
jgi:predicted SprT family Zn-dependent metalloprotease